MARGLGRVGTVIYSAKHQARTRPPEKTAKSITPITRFQNMRPFMKPARPEWHVAKTGSNTGRGRSLRAVRWVGASRNT
jgi:hypothetical protein